MSELLSLPTTEQVVAQMFAGLDVRPNTQYEYGKRIHHFLKYLETHQLGVNSLLEYKRHLAEADMAVATKNKYLTCARVFLRECYRHGLLMKDITVNVKNFEQSKKHKVDGLSEAEAKQLCEWMRDSGTPRLNAMLSLLLFQGFRQVEVCRLQAKDVDLASETIWVLGKGKDDKEKVYLHSYTAEALKQYLRVVDLQSNDHLFTSKSRRSRSQALTERGLRSIVLGVFEKLGIEKNVHGLRHYFTTRLIQHMPGELITVSRFTRHSSLEMLQVYNDSVMSKEDVGKFSLAFDSLLK
ncbi:MAG: integrase/recombinase XerD [Patescibacteria group bacterium]|jgi:site-specific recombinase XerD|nr:integrase/recombinase XerD [Patescibacteria group bacterium]